MSIDASKHIFQALGDCIVIKDEGAVNWNWISAEIMPQGSSLRELKKLKYRIPNIAINNRISDVYLKASRY
jgi:hypothetical protein